MLIVINDSAASNIDFNSHNCIVALKNIFVAYREGKHYVLFNQLLLDLLKENEKKFPGEINAAIKNAALILMFRWVAI